MLVENVPTCESPHGGITIGRRASHGTERVVFDLSYLIKTYGEGVAELLVKRPVDSSAYPAITSQQDNTLTWIVSDVDTAYKGAGECEIFWYVDDGLAKSIIYPLTIMRDIGETTEDVPAGYQNWVDHLTELGAETLENAQEAAESASEAKESEINAEESEINAKASEEASAQSEADANASALKSEGFAVGEQNGEAVASGSPYYQNNAKYYAEVSQQGAEESGYVWFDVNLQDGEMYVTITPSLEEDVSFLVNEAVGTLEVTYG